MISIQSNETWLSTINSIVDQWHVRGFITSLVNLHTVVIDQLINAIEQFDLNGVDKKESVLWAIEKIYDSVLLPALPFYLWPFRKLIKNATLTAADKIIEFVVAKYNEGLWRQEANDKQKIQV